VEVVVIGEKEEGPAAVDIVVVPSSSSDASEQQQQQQQQNRRRSKSLESDALAAATGSPPPTLQAGSKSMSAAADVSTVAPLPSAAPAPPQRSVLFSAGARFTRVLSREKVAVGGQEKGGMHRSNTGGGGSSRAPSMGLARVSLCVVCVFVLSFAYIRS
jgi:hypothetical protein